MRIDLGIVLALLQLSVFVPFSLRGAGARDWGDRDSSRRRRPQEGVRSAVRAAALPDPMHAGKPLGKLGNKCYLIVTLDASPANAKSKLPVPGAHAPGTSRNRPLNPYYSGDDRIRQATEKIAPKDGELPMFWYRRLEDNAELRQYVHADGNTKPCLDLPLRSTMPDKGDFRKVYADSRRAVRRAIDGIRDVAHMDEGRAVHPDWCVVNDVTSRFTSPSETFGIEDRTNSWFSENDDGEDPVPLLAFVLCPSHRFEKFGALVRGKCAEVTRKQIEALRSAKTNAAQDSITKWGIPISGWWASEKKESVARWFNSDEKSPEVPLYRYRLPGLPSLDVGVRDHISTFATDDAVRHAGAAVHPDVVPCLDSYPAERFGNLRDVRDKVGLDTNDELCTVSRIWHPELFQTANKRWVGAWVSVVCPVVALGVGNEKISWFGQRRPIGAVPKNRGIARPQE